MINQRGSSFSQALHVREPNATPPIGLGIRASSVSTARDSYQTLGHRRRNRYQVIIESPLAHLTEEEIERDVREFHREFLPLVNVDRLLRAVQVAKDIRIYDKVARSEEPHAGQGLPVQLTAEEKVALKKEKDSLPSEPTMLMVFLTVSLAAFLQGFVQSSINGASLYADKFGLDTVKPPEKRGDSPPKPTLNDWKLGAVNAAPYLFAALVGCWLALPINERVGRRGAMAIAACLIFASSLGASFCTSWEQLFGVRVLNGIGMGIKAVSTPILASETAVGYWRGTSILAWQLWVAFGIAVGFAFNLIFYLAGDRPLFSALLRDKTGELNPMLYSLGYGAVNFFFGLPAIRTIDTLGRRKWLVVTLPLMCLFMTSAALSTLIPKENDARGGVIALFIFLFAAAYSPGLGPIPFTLASERLCSISHYRIGCAFAVATNLLFAGLLSIFFPSIYAELDDGGTLGLFAGLNLVAFILVFLLVEETKRRSLEDLKAIFAVKKSRFTRYQVVEYLPWFCQRYILGRDVPRPELYLDLIWGNQADPTNHHSRGDDAIEIGAYNKPDRDGIGGQGLFNTTSPFSGIPARDTRRASGEDDDHW
ncbi:hypothetical protein GQX73_g1797 [Xylaria multiplex]|uniref:Major facilitator superfamily (MFS) profile domain-containing protein n=1 Tax=Xylaria multiplex TaxID=323545 RepID=A0A7C8J658_9PEZI|nr:hypothetical protein GQX73_g1797 [Xylaria multiplex]